MLPQNNFEGANREIFNFGQIKLFAPSNKTDLYNQPESNIFIIFRQIFTVTHRNILPF